MEKDTRTAWGQEFDARREAESELAAVKRELAKTKAERDALAREVDEANDRAGKFSALLEAFRECLEVGIRCKLNCAELKLAIQKAGQRQGGE